MHQSIIYLFACLAVYGCALSPPQKAENLTELYQQLPTPDITLNIPGLGPCNDSLDRNVNLSSQHPVTILVHGCHGSAGRFRSLSEVMAFHGQQSACFSYNDRHSMMRSSRQLSDVIETLAQKLSESHITVIGHSQGGLVARKALVIDRDDPIKTKAKLQLVTVSAPLSGIRAARYCAVPALRVATLGVNDLVCWAISGSKWYEITDASEFISSPGELVPAVERYMLVSTDETGSCRKYNDNGSCIEDDYVFSLEEQRLPKVHSRVSPNEVQVKAGHVEIVGDYGITPKKLINILQKEGYIEPTEVARLKELDKLLVYLYGVHK